MYDEDDFSELKSKHWRGSRVLKLVKRLKSERRLVREKREMLTTYRHGESSIRTPNIHGEFVAVQKTLMWVNRQFDVKSSTESKLSYTRRLFAGSKILSIIEFMDFQRKCLEKELKELRDLTLAEDLDYFIDYLNAQKDQYDKMEDWVLSGQLEGDEEEYEEDED